MNSETMQPYKASLKEIKSELASRNLKDFTQYTFPKYEYTWVHTAYTNKLNEFAKGKIKKLMVFMPPQHGKSEISTRRLPSFMLGNNPELNIAIISYSDTKAKKFNREIKRIIDDPTYKDIFPEMQLPRMMADYTNSSNEFEIVGHKGNCKTVGVGGPLTGEPVDVLIMDDLYKDQMSAWSSIQRDNVSEWYDSVADTRLHNDSQQLIVFTRWHPDDLAGRLLKHEPDEWEVVIFEAIKDLQHNEFDPRERGEALWPSRHSLDKLTKSRNRNPHVFQSLYQQNPKPKEGLLYDDFKTYDTLPEYAYVKNVTDTADSGTDYLCAIDYVEHNKLKYVIDVLYTQKPNEYTEGEQAAMLLRNEVNHSKIESNNGGRAYARNVERITRGLNNDKTKISWFHQSNNKEARIQSNSSTVNNTVVMPDNWHIRWPDFYEHVTNYMAVGKNSHDDAPDTLTMIVENIPIKRPKTKLLRR